MDELKYYKNTSVLVTGGASFIGSHLTEKLLEFGANITIIDDLSSGKLENLENIKKEVNFVHGDARDDSILNQSLKNTDIVFNLAAMHGGRGYIETHPVESVNNMVLDHFVFEAACKNGVETIVHASSACVYPTNLQDSEDNRNLLSEGDANFDEPGKAFSDGEYGWAKLMGELQLNAFVKQYGINGVAGRIFTAYGERENESHAAIALIAKAVLRMDPYPIWGNGQQTRNFTHVQDTVKGLLLSGTVKDGFSTLNIGSSSHHTVLELCEEIFRSIGWSPVEYDFQLDKPVGVKSRASDNTKILHKFNWEPDTSLEEGVKRTVEWYVHNLDDTKLENLESLLMER
jgi:nucleoside-diphosphate-sugar epimerase